MKQPTDLPARECLFAQTYSDDEEDGDIFIGLYRFKGRLLMVTTQERGGDIEIELSPDDAVDLISALQRGLKKEPNPESCDRAQRLGSTN